MKKFFLLALSLLGFISVQAQTSPYKGSEAAAGNFFIYNVETGYWLQNNNRVGDWNSQVQVDTQGFDWELIALEGDTWQLNPKFGSNHSLNSGEANGYMDTGQPVSAWTLTPANDGNNGYMISSNGTTLGVNPDTKLLTKDGSGATTWQLVTAEERLQVQAAKYAEVTGENPMDLTWMIPGANMNQADEHADALVKVFPEKAGAKFVTGQTNINPGNGIREIWSNDGGSYDIGYTLTGLPEGVYRFTVSGYYRDGSCDNAGWTGVVGQKYQEGTEVIRPEIYLNDQTQPIMSICAPELKSAAHGCNRSSAGFFVPDNTGQAAEATAAGLYMNKAMKVVINDGVIELGVRADDGIADDWLILDKFQLVYYGPDNLEQYVALLQAAINEAEALDSSNTSTAMANALNAAIDDAKAKLTSTDSDELEAATDALQKALQAAKGVDVSVLKATIALAKKEGINTSAADEVVRNATSTSEIAGPLYVLSSWRKVNAQKMADLYAGTEPAAGEFYFFNLGAGMFLSAGSDWNTHAAVDQAGWPVSLEEAEGGYTLHTPWGSFNESPYVDTGVNAVYAFQPVEGKEGIYNILQGEKLLGWNPNGHTDGERYWSSISNTADIDATDPYYQWKLVTREEREALLEKASGANPIDATFLLNNPSLIRKPGYDMWTMECNGGNGGARISDFRDARDRAADYGWEVWNADNFKFTQTVVGLKPGLYEVSATGFWREGDGGNQANIVNNGGALNQKAYLFANDEKAYLPNVASCPDFVPGVATQACVNGKFPNWPEEAIAYFETGAFKTTVLVNVGEDGTLDLGIACDEKVGNGDWSVFDNFRLTYLGSGEQNVDYVRALQSIENGANYSVFTEIEGKKYYVTNDGKLTADHNDAGTFTFQQATGEQYEKGYLLNSKNKTRFSNPYTTTEAALTNGSFNVTTNNRTNWEAQVFFENEEGLYAVRSTNAKYSGETSGWNWIGNTYWTANEGPLAEYSWEPNYIWQLEKNTLVEISCKLVEDGEVTATELVTMPAGFAPTTPATFSDKFHGLYELTPDVEMVTEETTAINYTAAWAGPFEFSESFENAKWYNMTIRTNYYVAVDETEPYYPNTDKDLDAEVSQWAFKAVEGEPFQIIIWNRSLDAASSLSVDGDNVVMREGETKWEIFGNNGGFVMRPVGGGENDWVNQNGGSTGPLQFWKSANGKTDDGSTFRVEAADPYERALAAIEDGANYSIYTEIEGTKYYVTNDGHLTAEHNTAGTFTFQQVTKDSGLQYEYGYLLNSQNNTRFSNPYTTTEAALTNGSLNTSTNTRVDWEAQVFFLSGDGKYAVRATNAPYNNETSGWNWIGNTYWTANEGPVAEYSWEPAYIWQLEKNTLVEIACNLVEDGEVTATETATVAVGFAPVAPAAFKDKFHGLYSLTPDVEVVAKETTVVNFTPAWAGPFEFSESFEGAKWYNMTIRGSYYVAVDETEPYYPKADKTLNVAESQWAFKAVEGEPFQIIVWNRAFDEGSSLSVDGDNVVMREGEAKWEIFGNGDGFVMRPVGGGENDWVNQNGGSSGPLQFWKNAAGKTDNGSTFRVEEAPDLYDAIHDVNADTKVDGVIYDIAGRRVAQPTKGVFIINRKKVAVK
ncbi:MAG: hypothetical protein ILA06_07215 [Bacteroidaceae bacterium]|nr:hypothetical protein [Bacteroidaceae bacterium]